MCATITTAEVLSSSITQIFIPSLSFLSQVRGAKSDVDSVWPVRGFDLSVGGGGRVARVVVGGGRDLLVLQIQSCWQLFTALPLCSEYF